MVTYMIINLVLYYLIAGDAYAIFCWVCGKETIIRLMDEHGFLPMVFAVFLITIIWPVTLIWSIVRALREI